jgi:hypothetical protein
LCLEHVEQVKIRFGSGRGEGYCQAVLADLLKSWENGVDLANLDTLIPADKMSPAPATAFELKGDKLGTSMAEYLQRHSDDCVGKFSASPEVRHSVFSGNVLKNTSYQHVNAFRFACQNLDTVYASSLDVTELARKLRSDAELQILTLATARMDREQMEFSQQRLYLLAYYFKRDSFALVRAAFILKFGPPTNTNETAVQNGFGAQFKSTNVTWKNGVSTIELSETSGNDLNQSQVVMILDGIYSAVLQREGGKAVKAVQNDM